MGKPRPALNTPLLAFLAHTSWFKWYLHKQECCAYYSYSPDIDYGIALRMEQCTFMYCKQKHIGRGQL
jgi:hypothetical protein